MFQRPETFLCPGCPSDWRCSGHGQSCGPPSSPAAWCGLPTIQSTCGCSFSCNTRCRPLSEEPGCSTPAPCRTPARGDLPLPRGQQGEASEMHSWMTCMGKQLTPSSRHTSEENPLVRWGKGAYPLLGRRNSISTALEVAFRSQGLRIPSGSHGCVSSVGWWGVFFRDLRHQQVEQKLTNTQPLYHQGTVLPP